MIGLKTHRWNHIFREDGKALIVAMDHPGVFGMMGVVTRFAEEIGGMGIVLRVDGGGSSLAKEHGPMQLLYNVYDALRVGVDAVGCMGMPGSVYETETLPYLSELVAQCAEWNVPVMAEMLPGGFENPASSRPPTLAT